MRTIFAVLIPLVFLVATAGDVSAQTSTPAPEATEEPQPYRYDTIDGQTVRFDYVLTTGDVAVGGLLLVLVVSVWIVAAIFYFGGQQHG